MIELELTYLAKYLPDDLESHPMKEMQDAYIPVSSPHPNLRIRRTGEKYEFTRKTPINEGDATAQIEETIELSSEEYNAFSVVTARRIRKLRYYYPIDEITAEVDVFLDDLAGLVVVDVEFDSEEAKAHFIPPEFCLREVTQEKFLAGGVLSGKTYEDIAEKLSSLGYKKLRSIEK